MFRIRLKQLREKTGMSQYAFAAVFGVAQSTVGSWEAGAREPNLETILRLADFFGVSTDYLLDHETEIKEGPQATPLGDMEITLLNRFSSLPEAVKQHALEYLDLLTNGTLVAGGAQLSEEQKAEILNSRNVETDTDHNSNSHKDAG